MTILYRTWERQICWQWSIALVIPLLLEQSPSSTTILAGNPSLFYFSVDSIIKQFDILLFAYQLSFGQCLRSTAAFTGMIFFVFSSSHSSFFFNQTLRSTNFTFAGMISSSGLLKGSSEERYDLDIYCHLHLILI